MKKIHFVLIAVLATLVLSGTAFAATTVLPNAGGTGNSILRVGAGDILVGSSSTSKFEKISTSTSAVGWVLTTTSTYPYVRWQALPASSATITGSGAAGWLTYWTGASDITGSSTLFFDTTNVRLGVGTAIPSSTLHVVGTLRATATSTLAGITGTNITTTGGGLFGDVGGVYASAVGAGGATLGFNSTADGAYTAGVDGYGALMQLNLGTGQFTMFAESNASSSAAHSHIEAIKWSNTGAVTLPVSLTTVLGTFSGAVKASTTLDVTGAAIFGSTFQSGNNTTLGTLTVSGAVRASSTLDVTGATILGSTLQSGNNLTLGTMTITGALKASSTVDFSGAVISGSTLQVGGATTLFAGLTGTTATFSGAVKASSTLEVTGASQFAGINGGATTLTTLSATTGTFSGAVKASTTLEVSGNSILSNVSSTGRIAIQNKEVTATTTKAFIVLSPTATMDVPFFQVPAYMGMTFGRVICTNLNAAGNTVTFNLKHGSTNAGLNQLFSSNQACTATSTTPTVYTAAAFSSSTMASGDILRFVTSAASSTGVTIQIELSQP